MSPADKYNNEFTDRSELDYKIHLNRDKLENISDIGKIWGFLKYHHPAVGKGNYNWDFELFRILKKMHSATDQNESQETLYTWIARLGPIKSKVSKVTSAEITSRSNYDWISKGRFSKKVVSLLLKISESVQSHEHYYVSKSIDNENTEFRNERPYYQMTYSDDGYKILSLFRLWSVIEYYYPYRYLIDDWNNTLTELLPVFLAARNRLEYEVAILRMLTKVGDSHANIYCSDAAIWSEWGRRYADVDLLFIDNEVVISNVSINDGLYANVLNGDILEKINGVSVKDLIQERLPITPGSNPSGQMRSLCSNLLRSNESSISVDVLRDAKRLKFDLSTVTLSSQKSKLKTKTIDASFKVITPGIGYLIIANLKKSQISSILPAMAETKTVIVDLRSYPTDDIIYELGNYFIPARKEFAKYSTASLQRPGEFVIAKQLEIGNGCHDFYRGKIILLVNEATVSHGEFMAMAFSVAPKVTIVGSTTSGTDGNVSTLTLPGGIVIGVTGIGIYYPDGRETQRIGIQPDILSKSSIKGIRNCLDEVLETALRHSI